MTDILFQPAAAPFWVFLGVIVTKLVDWVIARSNKQSDPVAQAISGHVALSQSLQSSFEAMSQELTRLREDRERDAADFAEREARYQDRIKQLEDELHRLQNMVLLQQCPQCAKGD